MVGREVHQVYFSDDMEEVVIMTSLSKERVGGLVESVRAHDHAFVAGSEHDLDGSHDANHPLSKWRDSITGGAKFSDSLAFGGKCFWVDSLHQSVYILE
jgi:hypothetical protein